MLGSAIRRLTKPLAAGEGRLAWRRLQRL